MYDQVCKLNYHTCLVRCTINIIDWDQIGEGVSGDIIQPHPFNINEAACFTTVDKGLCALPDCCVHQFDLYIESQ
jgi:hypothetical protein